ncbi:MAG TPA: hypothetical protein PK175_02200 [Syntrophales bacterium]|jgi:hypothetical protein|nr:hypothetical protein [Syntrophales bacterium]HON22548.1 hypothetical protein [Syntrophales bacterium]HOU77142.1 hypothetical protein [Syntrophales bacterium]HPC33043.1 hypothetical protein [Syntrophales bacterium]HQG33670.1 hypothetical protein [Syntrophales bacterium]
MRKIFPARSVFIYVVGIFLLFAGPAAGPAPAKTHADVVLKNEIGETISPSRNRTDPYSPRRTCGGCHGYATITSGYHFQQGFDEMSDRYSRRQPWILSPGMFGKWQPAAAAALLAPKKNTHGRWIDLSTYDWIGGGKFDGRGRVKATACGWCHPGGGPLEYGRKQDGRCDLTRNHIQAESRGSSSRDGDYSSRFTPDRRSRFRESGVVEADCLICHQPGYRLKERNRQLSMRNYRWAATVGAGLGTVSGAVFTYRNAEAGPEDPEFTAGNWNSARRPVVRYNWRDRKLFTSDGRLRGAVFGKPVSSANCLQCHGEAEAKNTGTIHAGRFDVHLSAGFRCTDCHGLVGRNGEERRRHQIAKGWSPHNTVRSDLNGAGMKTCVTCHVAGGYGAARPGMPAAAGNPAAAHAEKFAGATFHTFIIQCAGCHAGERQARGMYLLDMSAGGEVGYTADNLARAIGPEAYAAPAVKAWRPWLARTLTGRDRQERYVPYVPKSFQWFGERESDGAIRPIALHEVRAAMRTIRGGTVIEVQGTDGRVMKQPSVLADEDIKMMIVSLKKRGFKNVVYVADRVYEVDKGKIVASARPPMDHEKPYPVVHGMTPVSYGTTYGSKGNPDGCLNCHADDAVFFSKMKIKDIRGFLKNDYPVLKEPASEPQMYDWGMSLVPAFE